MLRRRSSSNAREGLLAEFFDKASNRKRLFCYMRILSHIFFIVKKKKETIRKGRGGVQTRSHVDMIVQYLYCNLSHSNSNRCVKVGPWHTR